MEHTSSLIHLSKVYSLPLKFFTSLLLKKPLMCFLVAKAKVQKLSCSHPAFSACYMMINNML